ncbi:MAG: hypothetical protein LVQ96_03905 [Thermoplasmatales archaeon]|nr:hypothetical protein [Thermoplasmatales archaeon]
MSVHHLADEIVIIDSSDDADYIKYNNMIVNKLKDKIVIKYFFEDMRITQARRRAKSESSKEIIVHWDADMVALDNGTGSLSEIINLVKSIKVKKVAYFPLLTPYNDLTKVVTKPIDVEGWIFSNTTKELYRPRSANLDSKKFVEGFSPPKYFRRIVLNSFGGIHLKYVMPSEKAIYKQYDGYLINDKLVEEYGDYKSIRENLKEFSPDEEPNWEPYNESVHGSYPKILERFVGLSKPDILKIKQDEIKNMTIASSIEEMIHS